MAHQATLPKVIAEFDRDKHVPEGYSPKRHVASSLVLCAIILTGAVALVRHASAGDWLLLPAFYVIANFLEWAFHKGPMHRPMKQPGAKVLYINHTLIHHRAFLHNNMPVRSAREYGLILMPWYTLILLMLLATPAGLVAWAFRGPGALGVFYIFAVGYYMHYEILHSAYHLPIETLEKWGLLHNPVFRWMRNHHAHHHRLDRMAKVNFNVTLAIADAITGTREGVDLQASDEDTASKWDEEMDDNERDALRGAG